MIKNLTLLKPNKENLNLYVSLGGLFFALGIIDVLLIFLVFYQFG